MELSTKSISAMHNQIFDKTTFCLGLGLAIISSLFIGSSFILKKISLMRLNNRIGSLRAGSGGFGYLKDWIWWLGLLTMGVGEFANFAAYAFAPASLVTPLGALSVIVSAILASKFLNEHLNGLGKLGCLLCILGSIIIVIHSPKEEEIESIQELLEKLQDATFINYVIIVTGISLIIIFYVGPRYGNRHVMVYVSLCSTVGSLTVMACKGLGLALKESIHNRDFNSILVACPFFLFVIVCISIQMNYLNKALDLFNTSVVTPVYYVMFTTLVIIASAILFKEWVHMSIEDIIGSLCGFLIVIAAIFLLQAFKDLKLLSDNSSNDYFKQNQCTKNDWGSTRILSRIV